MISCPCSSHAQHWNLDVFYFQLADQSILMRQEFRKRIWTRCEVFLLTDFFTFFKSRTYNMIKKINFCIDSYVPNLFNCILWNFRGENRKSEKVDLNKTNKYRYCRDRRLRIQIQVFKSIPSHWLSRVGKRIKSLCGTRAKHGDGKSSPVANHITHVRTNANARSVAERQISAGGSRVAAVLGEPSRVERCRFRIVLRVVVYRVHGYQHGSAHVHVHVRARHPVRFGAHPGQRLYRRIFPHRFCMCVSGCVYTL